MKVHKFIDCLRVMPPEADMVLAYPFESGYCRGEAKLSAVHRNGRFVDLWAEVEINCLPDGAGGFAMSGTTCRYDPSRTRTGEAERGANGRPGCREGPRAECGSAGLGWCAAPTGLDTPPASPMTLV